MAKQTEAQDTPLLQVANEEKIKQDLYLEPIGPAPEKIDPVLEKKANDFVEQLMSDKLNVQDKRAAIDTMGLKTQQEAAYRSSMLREPIRNLAKTGDDGGPVAKGLMDLKDQVEELDPVNFDFTAAGVSRMLQRIPFVGKPINRYFMKYQSAEMVMNTIIKSLELGREQLKRDNITLAQDQEHMRNTMAKLEKAIQLGQLLDQKLQYKLDREIAPESDQYGFIQEELLFPLRQRILDLQQTLAVNQQGILTTEIIIRNNRELIRGVDRALNVTVTALQIAVACALALANQQIVLKKIDALNKTTSNIIAHTSERLKTQGTVIHKQASSSMLDMQTLEKAFADIKTAIDDISKFRREALPQMANNILRLDALTKDASKAIEKMDKARAAQPAIVLDIE